MTIAELSGTYPALVTPFTADGSELDESALADIVDRCITAQVDGLLPCGGTGEFVALSTHERQRVVEIVCEQSKGRVPVVAQTGGLSVKEAIGHSVHAKESGADAIMVGPPFYEPLSEDQAVRYYSALAAAVDLPIMFYNYPYATGFDLTPEFLRRLADAVPTVRYIKDSGGNFGRLTALVAAHPQVRVFTGTDTLSGPAYLAGAAGVVNGASNITPTAFARMAKAAAAGDATAVTREWQLLLPLLSFLESHPFVSAVKHGCAIMGCTVGPVRQPLDELTGEEVAELVTLLEQLSPHL